MIELGFGSLVSFTPFVLPALLGVGLWWLRPPAARSRQISLGAAALLWLWSLACVLGTGAEEVAVHPFGDWAPPFGVAFALDGLSALFVALHATLLGLALLVLRPEAHGEEVVQRAHPLLWWLTLGLLGAFMTADLFNLFVMFEVVLVASYLLLQVPGSRRARAAALPTVVFNLVTSLLFLTGLGILYGIGGSVSLPDLVGRLGEADPALRRVALGMLVVAFCGKAAVVPLCFWMPATYPTLSAPLAALLAGIMGKLGVYSLIRILPLLRTEPMLLETLVAVGAASALLGVWAALSQVEVRRLLAFHSVSQVGYIVVGVGLASELSVAAAIFFSIHHALVKSSLYLVSDELERASGSRDLRAMQVGRPGGVTVAFVFGVAAFSLAGLPPFSGFFGKLGVFRAALDAGSWGALAALLAASVLTLASMLKIWQYAFARRPSGEGGAAAIEPTPRSAGRARVRPGRGALLLAAGLVLALGLATGPAWDRAVSAARGVLQPDGYVEAVMAAAGPSAARREAP